MTTETELIKKNYYETFIGTEKSDHPIQVLGRVFMDEQQKGIPDLSYIRFAQGEVYFENKDFEAAIFKWENITNELEPWAKKNMADAYYELGILSTAEELYQLIVTDNIILNTEVALQLFSLYLEREKFDSAVTIIKKIIVLNPDYPNVTEIAQAFFEEKEDWSNAIELAVTEAIRTESMLWFDTVKRYVDRGLTNTFDPAYFSHALTVLYSLNPARFEQLLLSVWNSYKNEKSYFSWLEELNGLLLGLSLSPTDSWNGISHKFKETYLTLINGKYLIKKLQPIIPSLLTNWLLFIDQEDAVVASTAILSWSEIIPSSIESETVNKAEVIFSNVQNNNNELYECLRLFDSITEWADTHGMGNQFRSKWMVDKLMDFETQHIFLAGLDGSGKSSFINFIFGDEIIENSPSTSVVMFKDFSQLEIGEITEHELLGISDFQERMNRRRNALGSIVEYKLPNPFLLTNGIAFIDTPGINGHQNEVMNFLHITDSILFVLDVGTGFPHTEITYLQKAFPEVPIHFLLNKMDTIYNEQEAIRIFNEMKMTINSYLPNAELHAFSVLYNREQQMDDLGEFIQSVKNSREIGEKRLAKLLLFIRTTITNLLQKRIEMENRLHESIRWNEEMIIKLNGAIHQVHDHELQKTKGILRTYISIKEKFQTEMSETIPRLLQDCSKLFSEESDFSKIHIKLNKEMNSRLQDYLENEVLPSYFRALLHWINQSREELKQEQAILDDMGDSFNNIFGEERLKLECDFKILDDWRRDTDRMTGGFHLENINILLRRTPSQLLLKGAGKLFGALSQNKAMIDSKYKAFVENEEYEEATVEVLNQFFRQFELFEKSLERDMTWFFKGPLNVLNTAVEDARTENRANEDKLKKMNTNPELFRDPLTLFEVRLRQLEWLNLSGEKEQLIYQ